MTLPQYKDLHILPLRLFVPTLLFSLISHSAQAVEQTAAKALLNPSRVSVPVLSNVEFADSTQPFGKVEQGGKDAAMSLALLKILPPDWKIVFHNDLIETMKKKVSWAGGDQWPYVLQRLLEANKLQAVIDWNNRRVSLTKENKGVTKVAVVNKQGEKVPTKFLSEPQVAPLKIPVVPKSMSTQIAPRSQAVPLPTWRGEAGSTLKDTLFSWAAGEKCSTPGVNNWTVAWLTSTNYRIDAPLQFAGSFNDALNSLFTLYGTAKVPLYAGIRHAQCVISVDDKEIH